MSSSDRFGMFACAVGLLLCAYLFHLYGRELEAIGGRLDVLEKKVVRVRKPATPKPEVKPDGDK